MQRSIRYLLSSIVTVVALGASTPSHAQCGGVNVGGGNCVPPTAAGMPGYDYGNGQASGGTIHGYANRWGSVAIDKNNGLGFITDQTAWLAARLGAWRGCVQGGGKGCKTITTYRNTCIAVARGQGGYAFATNDEPAEAAKEALASCSASHDSCTVDYQGCSRANPIIY